MFGDELSANATMMDPPRTPPRSSTRTSLPPSTPKTPSRNLFTFMSPSQRGSLTPGSRPNSNGSGGSNRSGDLPTRDIYSLSPIRFDSQRLLLSPRREPRAIPKVPYKVLDAPDLKDDFYLNLVDWGAQNILAVGLGSSVYLWNAHNGIVKKLVDLGDQDHITGIGWIQRGTHLAVGTNKGLVRIWDTESSKPIRTMTGHTQRVGMDPIYISRANIFY
jgi:cell division cycle 20-like protein 1, cofactor of APC complex